VGAAYLLAPGAASAGTLDQQQTDATGAGADISSTISLAQGFTPGITGQIDQVDLVLGKLNSPTAPLSIEIRDISGGIPGNVVLGSQSVPASSVLVAPAFVQITFSPPASVSAGTQYAIVAHSATTSLNLYQWRENGASSPNPYPGGVGFYANSPPPATWTASPTIDFAFKTYVVPGPPATPTGQRAAALKKCKKKHSHKKRKKCRKKANLLPV
jgi:hypothetical protein